MSDLHLRPRSVSELVDAAFTLYRRNPLPYIVISAIATTPVIVLQTVAPLPLDGQPGAGTGAAVLAWILGWIGQAIMNAGVTRAGADAYLGGEPDVAAALRHTVARLPVLMVAMLLKGLLYGIGVLFLLVGALYVAARWFAVGTVVILEERGATEAFERSTRLSEDLKMHALLAQGLVWTIYFVLVIAVSVATIPLPNLVEQVVDGVASIVAFPVVALTGTVLYYDARIRNEGFDLEHMAGALDAPTTEPR